MVLGSNFLSISKTIYIKIELKQLQNDLYLRAHGLSRAVYTLSLK